MVFTFVRARSLFTRAFTFILLYPGLALAFTQCYYPDGAIPQDYVWEPCTGNTYSSCCVPGEGDVCQPDGLCYYPQTGYLYRGTCTDRTWNDPSCNSDICVDGSENTWEWVVQCQTGSSTTYACGNVTDGVHEAPVCAGSAATETSNIIMAAATTSYGRYTPPASLDTNLYSLITSSYTVTITAELQSTSLITSTYESTFTSTLDSNTASSAAATGAGSTNAAASGGSGGSTTKKVVLATGLLVAVIVGPLVLIAIVAGIAIFFILRRRSAQKGVQISEHPPHNGPVGADQVYPYEAPVNEISNPNTYPDSHKYNYVPPVPEVDGWSAGREEKKWGEAVEMNGYDFPVRTPAPTYSEAILPVELDGTSSLRGRSERF